MRLVVRGVVRTRVMRQHYYNFAHKVLPSDVTTQPTLWGLISGDKAHSYLQMRWSDAAPDGDAQPAKGLMWIEPVRLDGVEIRVVRMPPPENATEAYYGAIARSPDGAVRYFVCEKGFESVYWAEWRRNMRIRGQDVQENAPIDVMKRFMDMPSNAAPWEVSASSIAGLPYLASFLVAVREEMGNARGNELAKQELAAGPGTPAGRSPATKSSSNTGAIVACLVISAIAVIVILQLL